ncbi:MAG: hypothetical protein JSR60_11585 [Proteobacteria bacterium]|nr:hypothetical protein [Pseudomonadota bacterium]
MRHSLVALATIALVAATATALAAAPKQIYRVDSVQAKIVNRHLVVHATGAVSSGGWTKPRLHMGPSHAEQDEQVIEFRANPPAGNSMVIQALLPVETTATFPLPRYSTVRVKVTSETNSVTAPIEH